MTNALTFVLPKDDGAANIVFKTSSEAEAAARCGCAYDIYQRMDVDSISFWSDKLYLPSLSVADNLLDAVIDRVLGGKANLIVDTARTLEEVGRFDIKFGHSPIFYLYKLGLLTNGYIAGGVYLDKDDVDLMVQENARLILTPSFDAGCGHGIPPLRMYLNRGLKISLGTMNNSFNKSGSVSYEAEVLRLLVNGAMCGQTVKDDELAAMCG